MGKSSEAFRTISEVSDILQVPQHVLRFWETRFTQVKPVKRAGGRRYYRPSDVALLAGIRKLLHEDGLTIRGVQKVLREKGVRHVSSLVSVALGDEAIETAGPHETWQDVPARRADDSSALRTAPDDLPPDADDTVWPPSPSPEPEHMTARDQHATDTGRGSSRDDAPTLPFEEAGAPLPIAPRPPKPSLETPPPASESSEPEGKAAPRDSAHAELRRAARMLRTMDRMRAKAHADGLQTACRRLMALRDRLDQDPPERRD
ncbi:MerR-like DNA binding protein [Albidovulum inexpectatum]|uniref:MerR-like DNA binding protein n=2 Tax=Albidovulum inexpectatum TaxID=196587 RepID=A0A2S5JEZ6_9RHOB|nr:MerR-like DNA binding protein [Albidovulum inexpectatum]